MTRWEEWRVRLGGWWAYHVLDRWRAFWRPRLALYCWTDYGNHLGQCEGAPWFIDGRLGRKKCTQDEPACDEGVRLWKLTKARRVRL